MAVKEEVVVAVVVSIVVVVSQTHLIWSGKVRLFLVVWIVAEMVKLIATLRVENVNIKIVHTL